MCVVLTSSHMPQEASALGNKLSYMVLPGNESILMSDAMAKRSWWKAVEKGSPNSFWWGGNGQKFAWQNFQQGRQTGAMAYISQWQSCSECSLMQVSRGKLSIKWRVIQRSAQKPGWPRTCVDMQLSRSLTAVGCLRLLWCRQGIMKVAQAVILIMTLANPACYQQNDSGPRGQT